MATKKTTPAKPKTATPPPDLAELLAVVMNHPDLPPQLEEYVGEELCEMFNDLSQRQKNCVEYTPTRLRLLLEATAENEKRGAR